MNRFFTYLLFFLFSSATWALTNSQIALSDEFSSIVLIKSEAPDSSGNSIPAYCNATFVAKNILITAAHCIKLAYTSQDYKINIQTGYYKFITKNDGSIVKIGYANRENFSKFVNIEIPQSLRDKLDRKGEKAIILPQEDFAMLWWNGETPEISKITVSDFVNKNEHEMILKNLSATKFNPVTINFFNEMSLDYRRQSELDNISWSKGHIVSKSKSRVEEGDSGAPVFTTLNSTNKIFSVVKGRVSNVLANWDAYPAIQEHICTLNHKMPMDFKLKQCQL